MIKTKSTPTLPLPLPSKTQPPITSTYPKCPLPKISIHHQNKPKQDIKTNPYWRE